MSDILLQSKARINEKIAEIEETTGKEHPTLSDGIQTLIDGYGQGGGEVITITTACVNALEAYNIFKEFIVENEKSIMFKKVSEYNEFVLNNEGAFFIINNTISYNSSSSGLFCRYNKGEGAFSFRNNISTSYDFVMNVGDKFEKVVLF